MPLGRGQVSLFPSRLRRRREHHTPATPALAVTPPGQIHYQGVLRSATDEPMDGDFDMVFRFHSADLGGDEIVDDSHTLASA